MARRLQATLLAAASGLALFAASTGCAFPGSAELPLKLVADMPLGKATARFDYEAIDPGRGLLFIADLAGSEVVVVDTRGATPSARIEEVQRVHGVIAVPDVSRVYATATGADELVTIDERSGKVLARVPAGDYPDGLAFLPRLNKIYVSDERGKTVAVIDAAHNRLLRLIPIGGEVGNTQFDDADGLVYANDKTNNELVAIDPASDRVVGRWAWSGCEGSHGLQLVAARALAYAACEDNSRLATMTLADHQQIDLQRLGGAPDVMAADVSLRRLYVAAENGSVSVFAIGEATPRLMGERKLAGDAHVVAVDPLTHRVYFPLRDVGGKAILRVMQPVL